MYCHLRPDRSDCSIDHSAARSVHSVEHIVFMMPLAWMIKHKPAAQVEYVVLDIQFAHAALAQHIIGDIIVVAQHTIDGAVLHVTLLSATALPVPSTRMMGATISAP